MATFHEVFANGFQATSIDAILKRTNLTKGALFHQFPTKLDLGYALVDEVISPMIIERWIRPLDAYENAIEGILVQLKTLIGKAPAGELRLGCPLNNLVQEMAPVDDGFQRRLNRALALWIDEMDQQLKKSQRSGFINRKIDTREVAHFTVMAHEGFYGMLKGLDDPKAFRILYNSLERYFQTLG